MLITKNDNEKSTIKFNNLVDLLERNCIEGNTGITHINGENDEVFVSYQDLFQKAGIILFNLQNFGIQPKDELVLQIDDNERFLYVFWACLMGGIIPVPLSVGNNDEHKLKLFKIWSKLNNPYLVTDEKYLNSLEKIETINNENISIEEIKQKTIYLIPLC